MYTGLQHAHSGLAYLVLAFLFTIILFAAVAAAGKKSFGPSRKLALVGMIFVHLQFIIGLILYFVSPKGLENLSGETMGDSYSRLLALEHPLTMIIAIVLITIGYMRAKRASEPKKAYRSILLFYSIGVLLILLRIPWQVWP